MSKDVADTWKDVLRGLLSSGMLLENAVASFLSGRVTTVYRYWRRNEHGLDQVFEVDLNTLYGGEGQGPTLDLFIECKYRAPTTEWFFGRDEHRMSGELAPNWQSRKAIKARRERSTNSHKFALGFGVASSAPTTPRR